MHAPAQQSVCLCRLSDGHSIILIHWLRYGSGISADKNAVDWVGTESGMPSYPVWSSGCATAGPPLRCVSVKCHSCPAVIRYRGFIEVTGGRRGRWVSRDTADGIPNHILPKGLRLYAAGAGPLVLDVRLSLSLSLSLSLPRSLVRECS